MDYINVAVYLLYKRFCSSKQLSELFSGYTDPKKPEINIELFYQRVHSLYEKKRILPETRAFLVQYPMWAHEATTYTNRIISSGVVILSAGNSQYPDELKEISDPPFLLFCKGEVSLLQAPDKLAVVGTRTPSQWGITKAKQLAFEATYCKVVTVSGLAKGIDSVVHEYTKKFDGKTIGILPRLKLGGLDRQCDLIVSEFPPAFSSNEKWMYIARNRLVAALTYATVVVEAPLRSGTLTTADLAISYDKNIYVVLPNPNQEASLGGLQYAIASSSNLFIQSLYDHFYWEERTHSIERYLSMISDISDGVLRYSAEEYRHLALVNVLPILWKFASKDINMFERLVVKLQRSGIIVKRKDKAVFNFSGYNSWQKT